MALPHVKGSARRIQDTHVTKVERHLIAGRTRKTQYRAGNTALPEAGMKQTDDQGTTNDLTGIEGSERPGLWSCFAAIASR